LTIPLLPAPAASIGVDDAGAAAATTSIFLFGWVHDALQKKTTGKIGQAEFS
jgi:hypothetical protein